MSTFISITDMHVFLLMHLLCITLKEQWEENRYVCLQRAVGPQRPYFRGWTAPSHCRERPHCLTLRRQTCVRWEQRRIVLYAFHMDRNAKASSGCDIAVSLFGRCLLCPLSFARHSSCQRNRRYWKSCDLGTLLCKSPGGPMVWFRAVFQLSLISYCSPRPTKQHTQSSRYSCCFSISFSFPILSSTLKWAWSRTVCLLISPSLPVAFPA